MGRSLWWLALVVATPCTVTPSLMVIVRAGTRRVPLLGVTPVRPPGWATVLSLVGIPLLFLGARGLGGDASPLPYFLGAAGVSLLIQVALTLRHNRRAEAR